MEYIIKTPEDRNLVIEAEKYERDQHGDYIFHSKEGTKVATVNQRLVFAVVQKEAEKSDYYWVYDWNEEDAKEAEHDDVCIDCRNQELFESEEFFNAVYDIVESLLSDDTDDNEPILPTLNAADPEEAK